MQLFPRVVTLLLGCLLVLLPVLSRAQTQHLYANAVDVNPWDACESAAKTLAFAGLTRTTYSEHNFFCEGQGKRELLSGELLCLRKLGLSTKQSMPVLPLLLMSDGRPTAVRCLFEKVNPECIVPTADVPGWPMPQFAGPTDDRCDVYRRGPATEPANNQAVRARNKPDPATLAAQDRQAYLEDLASDAAALAELQLEPPRLVPLSVVNPLFDGDGRQVRAPSFPLRTVIVGRPTLATTWWPGCEACERAIDELNKIDPFYLRRETAHPAPRLVILYPATSAQSDQAARVYLRKRFPGRSAWAATPFPDAKLNEKSQASLPQVLVFDVHGILRARTFASAFDTPTAPGWKLVEQPALLLNAALGDAQWRSPASGPVRLADLARGVARGQVPASPGQAPDTLHLDEAMVRFMTEWAARTRVEQREYGAQLLLDGDQVRFGSISSGLTARIHIAAHPADFRANSERAACTGCSGSVRAVGKFHTHPQETWFSDRDIQNVVWSDSISMLALPSGTLMLALATHERVNARPPTNPMLRSREQFVSELLNARFKLTGPAMAQSSFAFRPFAESPLVRQWIESIPTSEQNSWFVNVSAITAHRAASNGVALYIGKGTTLRRVKIDTSSLASYSWTGSTGSGAGGDEVGLSPYERLAIARMLRASLGDSDAFCSMATPGSVAPMDLYNSSAFTPEVRELIKKSAQRFRASNPDAQPVHQAIQGRLDDAGLLALLDWVQDEVEIFDGYLMHRKNRKCLLSFELRGIGKSEKPLQLLAWGPAKPKTNMDDEGSARSHEVDKANWDAMAFGDNARTLGCTSGVAKLEFRSRESGVLKFTCVGPG